jgi:hypothetical protein
MQQLVLNLFLKAPDDDAIGLTLVDITDVEVMTEVIDVVITDGIDVVFIFKLDVYIGTIDVVGRMEEEIDEERIAEVNAVLDGM